MKKSLLLILAMVTFAAASYGQIAHWPLDTDAGDIVGINHGIESLNGVEWFDDAERGQVLKLDGVDGIITLPDGLFTGLDNATITCWFNFAGGDWWQAVYSFGHINDPWAVYRLNPRSGLDPGGTLGVTILGFTRNWRDFVAENPIDTLTWYFTAGVFDADTFRFYLNDSLYFRNDSVPATPNEIMTDPNEAYIGKSLWEDPNFNGMVDDMRIYDYAMSEQEVLDLFNEPGVSVPERDTEPDISMWAANGRIYYIGLDEAAVKGVRVHSITGQLVYISDKITDLRETRFLPGLYVVNLSMEEGLVSKKVMIAD